MIAFVSGPYTGNTKEEISRNIKQAEIVAKELWKIGYATICPHKNSGFFKGNRDIFLSGYMEILKICHIIVMISNWVDSTGAKKEWIQSKIWGIPIFYWPGDQDKIKEFLKLRLEEGTI